MISMENKTESSSLHDSKLDANTTMGIIRKLLLFLLLSSLLFNQLLITNINVKLGMGGYLSNEINNIFYTKKPDGAGNIRIKLTGNLQVDVLAIIGMKGSPDIYGKKMNVSFDDIQSSIDIMKKYDPSVNTLSSNEFTRYLNITGKISCEFCCTVKSLTNVDGSPTCNCDHAKAMRGLAIYLIRNYDDEYSDDEILRELARWKSLFFPKQMARKLIREIKDQKFTSDVEALLKDIKLPAYDHSKEYEDDMENIPDMVGGC